jgi:tRNA threonylcarbamoyladenosine biosynthesis protein TsaE
MMRKEDELFISHSVEQTMRYGRQFAKGLKAGDVVGLQGNLGAGKTMLVKGMAEAFGIDRSEVQSPTFSIINEYEGRLPFYHIDFYRLVHEREAAEIGAEEYIYGQGICVIEWAARITSLLPDQIIWITLKNSGSNVRQINITKKGY